MRGGQDVSGPVYRRISISIAQDIVAGKYNKGDRLSGRSVLASHYRVSPETIRKAVSILKDMGILETEKGSGIEIISVDKAAEFMDRHNEIADLNILRNEIEQWARDQAEQTSQMLHKVRHIMNATERLNTASPLNPYQIKITADCKVLGKTVADVQFWHNTGGTIIAVRRGENLIVSPGPYATFCDGDLFFIVGDNTAYMAAIKLFFD